MNSLVSKIKEAQSGDTGEYSASVKVSLQVSGDHEVELIGKTVNITFDVDWDIRDWGIKDINIYPRGLVRIPVMYGGKEQGADSSIVVDLSDATIVWKSGHHYLPTELDVYIQGKTIQAELTITFIDKK
jgi:hypothetical protein